MKASLNSKDLTDGIAWHALPIGVIASLHVTDLTAGLSSYEAGVRRKILHRNEAGFSPRTWIFTGSAQKYVTASMILGALAAAFFQHWTSCTALISLLSLSEGWACWERWRARMACTVLLDSRKWTATVLRDGHVADIAALDLVPGDIIQVAKGDIVPADARLFAANQLCCQESIFRKRRGEVQKRVQTVVVDDRIGRQSSMIFFGSKVLNGSGRAIVIATGGQTEIGRVARPQDLHPDLYQDNR